MLRWTGGLKARADLHAFTGAPNIVAPPPPSLCSPLPPPLPPPHNNENATTTTTNTNDGAAASLPFGSSSLSDGERLYAATPSSCSKRDGDTAARTRMELPSAEMPVEQAPFRRMPHPVRFTCSTAVAAHHLLRLTRAEAAAAAADAPVHVDRTASATIPDPSAEEMPCQSALTAAGLLTNPPPRSDTTMKPAIGWAETTNGGLEPTPPSPPDTVTTEGQRSKSVRRTYNMEMAELQRGGSCEGLHVSPQQKQELNVTNCTEETAASPLMDTLANPHKHEKEPVSGGVNLVDPLPLSSAAAQRTTSLQRHEWKVQETGRPHASTLPVSSTTTPSSTVAEKEKDGEAVGLESMVDYVVLHRAIQPQETTHEPSVGEKSRPENKPQMTLSPHRAAIHAFSSPPPVEEGQGEGEVWSGAQKKPAVFSSGNRGWEAPLRDDAAVRNRYCRKEEGQKAWGDGSLPSGRETQKWSSDTTSGSRKRTRSPYQNEVPRQNYHNHNDSGSGRPMPRDSPPETRGAFAMRAPPTRSATSFSEANRGNHPADKQVAWKCGENSNGDAAMVASSYATQEMMASLSFAPTPYNARKNSTLRAGGVSNEYFPRPPPNSALPPWFPPSSALRIHRGKEYDLCFDDHTHGQAPLPSSGERDYARGSGYYTPALTREPLYAYVQPQQECQDQRGRTTAASPNEYPNMASYSTSNVYAAPFSPMPHDFSSSTAGLRSYVQAPLLHSTAEGWKGTPSPVFLATCSNAPSAMPSLHSVAPSPPPSSCVCVPYTMLFVAPSPSTSAPVVPSLGPAALPRPLHHVIEEIHDEPEPEAVNAATTITATMENSSNGDTSMSRSPSCTPPPAPTNWNASAVPAAAGHDDQSVPDESARPERRKDPSERTSPEPLTLAAVLPPVHCSTSDRVEPAVTTTLSSIRCAARAADEEGRDSSCAYPTTSGAVFFRHNDVEPIEEVKSEERKGVFWPSPSLSFFYPAAGRAESPSPEAPSRCGFTPFGPPPSSSLAFHAGYPTAPSRIKGGYTVMDGFAFGGYDNGAAAPFSPPPRMHYARRHPNVWHGVEAARDGRTRWREAGEWAEPANPRWRCDRRSPFPYEAEPLFVPSALMPYDAAPGGPTQPPCWTEEGNHSSQPFASSYYAYETNRGERGDGGTAEVRCEALEAQRGRRGFGLEPSGWHSFTMEPEDEPAEEHGGCVGVTTGGGDSAWSPATMPSRPSEFYQRSHVPPFGPWPAHRYEGADCRFTPLAADDGREDMRGSWGSARYHAFQAHCGLREGLQLQQEQRRLRRARQGGGHRHTRATPLRRGGGGEMARGVAAGYQYEPMAGPPPRQRRGRQ